MNRKLMIAIVEVQSLEQRANGMLWHLGRKLQGLKDSGLWKTEARTWNAFVPKVLGFSFKWSHVLMNVAKQFTEKEVNTYGVTKLGVLMHAPESARAELRRLLEAGASKLTLQRASNEREVHFFAKEIGRLARAQEAFERLTPAERTRFLAWVAKRSKPATVRRAA